MTKSGEDQGRRLRVKQQPPGWEPQQTKSPCCNLHEMCVLQTAQQGTIWVFGSHYHLSELLRYFFILVSKDTTRFLILIVIAHSDNHFVMAIASPMAVVHTLLFFLSGQWEHTYRCLGNSPGPHTEPPDPCQAWRERTHQCESLGRAFPTYNDSWRHGTPPHPGLVG